MRSKQETIIYISVTVLFVIICVVIVIFSSAQTIEPELKNPLKGSRKSSTRNKTQKKRKWKNHISKHREKKIYVKEEVDIDVINQKLAETLTDDEKSDLLDELIGSKHPQILKIVNRELDNENEDIRLEALELLAEFGNEEIFDNLNKALKDESAEVRKVAIELLDTVEIKGGSCAEADILAKGVADESEDVRFSALGILHDKPRFEFEMVAEQGISSQYTDVKEEILSELSITPSINGVNIMIKGLLDTDDDFREDVRIALENITEQDFNSVKAAESWWAKNQHKFEEDFTVEEEDCDYDEEDDL